MTVLRRLAYAALAFAYVHIVFGAIVRITGSGLGCGDHWPKCYGYWFPPMERMDLVIEVTHRYLAFGLSVTILALLAATFLRRREPGVGGRGGVLRPAALAFGLVLLAAVLGGVVVKLELTNPHVIVAHLGIAMALIGALTVTVARAGGFGAASLAAGGASARTWRGARVAAALALVAVLLGGLTAHLPGANAACQGFPHCRETLSGGEALGVHVVHRVVAFLLLFHTLFLALGVRRRGEAALVRRMAWTAFGVVLLQILIAAMLVELHLPAVWRSLHQAVGTLVWLATLVLAVLAHRGSRGALASPGDGGELRRPVAAATAAAMLAVDPSAAAAEPHAHDAWKDERPASEAASILPTELELLTAAGVIVVDEAAVERSVVELALFDAAGAGADVVEAVDDVDDGGDPATAMDADLADEADDAETANGPQMAGAVAPVPVPDVEGSAGSAADATVGDASVGDASVAEAPVAEVASVTASPVEAVDVVMVAEVATVEHDDTAAIAAERAALLAEFAGGEGDDEPHLLDRVADEAIEDASDETLADGEAELDANAAALAELDRLAEREGARANDAPSVGVVAERVTADAMVDVGGGPPMVAEASPDAGASVAATVRSEAEASPDADLSPAAEAGSAAEAAPPPAPARRPPTLAVIIARGADF